MHRSILIVAVVVLATPALRAQTYCDVMSAMAYSLNMPGITHVKLNTIDRTSASLECDGIGCNSVVMTSATTQLTQGQEYPFSITHTRDAELFPNVRNNIRVWIDFNRDGIFDQTSETAVSLDHQTFGTSTAQILIPSSAKPGKTRMRVTAKMSDDGGHELPTPCDIPSDPIGYHGEIEDYTVTILEQPTDVVDVQGASGIRIAPNPFTTSTTFYFPSADLHACVDIYDTLGHRVLHADEISEDHYTLQPDALTTGAYVVHIALANGAQCTSVVVAGT